MIGRLSGKVIAEEDDGTIVVDVGGVGYELTVPIGTIGRMRADAQERLLFFVHTHVREDIFALFGFASERERFAFRTLIGVSGVGPRTAVAVLSALPAGELAQAIARKELGKLTSISGIGKKTAERLLLELRDKLPMDEGVTGAAASVPKLGVAPEGNAELLASALTRLGYKAQEAERAVQSLKDKLDGTPITDLVKEALALLAKR